MSRQMIAMVGVLLAVFGFGFATGLYVNGAASASAAAQDGVAGLSSSASQNPEAQNDLHANTLLSSRIRELEKELGEKSEVQKTALADRVALFKKLHNEIRVRGWDAGGTRVAPEMVEILGLSKQEQAMVEKHLADSKAAMSQLRDEDLIVTKQTESSLALTVPADPKGTAIEDQLRSSLSSDIGEDRADVLMEAGQYGGEINRYEDFGNFSEGKKEIEITWTQQNGGTVYTVKESNFNADGKNTYGGAQTSTSFPAQYRKYLQTAPGP